MKEIGGFYRGIVTQVGPENFIPRVVSLIEASYVWVQRTLVSFLPIVKPPSGSHRRDNSIPISECKLKCHTGCCFFVVFNRSTTIASISNRKISSPRLCQTKPPAAPKPTSCPPSLHASRLPLPHQQSCQQARAAKSRQGLHFLVVAAREDAADEALQVRR